MSSSSLLSDLRFHSNTGTNMRISQDGVLARRINLSFFAKGLVFSSRPIRVREKVYIKLLEMTDDLGAFIYVGFTSKDPGNLSRNCGYNDLTNKPGYFTWFFPKNLCARNVTIFYYYNQVGDVFYGIEDQQHGRFSHKISLSAPVWACCNIFGNLNSIKMIDGSLIQQLIDNRRIQQIEELRYQPNRHKFKPLNLHKTRSNHVIIQNEGDNRNRAGHNVNAKGGCVFTYRPLLPEEVVVVKILQVDSSNKKHGCLNIGLTSCDPGSLTNDDLPANCDLLINRPEYWVQISDFHSLRRLDEVAFSVNGKSGEVGLFLNGNLIRVTHVDASLKLWAYFDVYGTTEQIIVFSSKLSLSDLDENVNNENIDRDKECMICYDNIIDTALYKCGHMCMCFECALEQWQGKGDGHCPLCRALIKDVIRILK